MSDDLVYRLRKRAEIRRQITTRKSVQNGERDRIADLLEEAATEIERLQTYHANNYLISRENLVSTIAALAKICEGDTTDFDIWMKTFTDAEWEDVDVQQAFQAGLAAGLASDSLQKGKEK